MAEDNLNVEEFEELFRERFPNHVLVSYGGTFFEYVVGNVQTAVANEILLMMETWEQTLKEASENPKFRMSTRGRDWEVALSHTQELMSEVRQYRTRGTYGHHSTHTGNVVLPEGHDSEHSDEL